MTAAAADRLAWMDAAACLEVGPDPFFEEVQGGADPVQAKALCRACEGRTGCLSWALEHQIREGLFGGFTDRPRRRITRRVKAGESLEDIIAADDERYYARLEREQEQKRILEAARLERRRVQDRARYAAQRRVAA